MYTNVNLEAPIGALALLGTGGPHGHRVLNPGFDRDLIKSRNAELLERLRAKYGRDRVPTTMGDDEDDPAAGAGKQRHRQLASFAIHQPAGDQ